MARKGPPSHHVVHDPDGGWAVRRGGAERATGHYDLKREAEKAGRTISRSQGTELRIHNLDGRIGPCDSHGRDPHPPKG